MRYSITAALALAIIPALALPTPASGLAATQPCLSGTPDSQAVNLGTRDDKNEAKEEGEKKNEKDLTGTFGTPVPLAGGDLKQDTSFKAVSSSQWPKKGSKQHLIMCCT